MKLKLRKRDTSIELMRIIACFFVICIHISVGFSLNGSFSKASTLFVSLFADAVAMFWFITGAFLLKRDDYKKVLKGTFKKVILPTLALIAFIFFLNDWMFEGQGIIESIKNSAARIPSSLETIFLWWRTPVPHTGQLWYIFVYIFVMICFPVIKAFVERIEKNHKEKLFLVVSFGILLLNDISNNHFANFSHTVIGALVPAVILIIWGHIIYKNKDKILAKIKSKFFIIPLVVLIFLRASVLIYAHGCGDGDLDRSIVYWYSCLSPLIVTSIFLFLEGGLKKITEGKVINWLILKIGSYTFMIYLLHELVIDFLRKFGIFIDIRGYFLTNGNIVKLTLYYLALGGIIFLISLLASIVLRLIANLAKRGHQMYVAKKAKPKK